VQYQNVTRNGVSAVGRMNLEGFTVTAIHHRDAAAQGEFGAV
jgi:hypothetical protein